VLVANERHVPRDPGDGVVLARWQRKPDQDAREMQLKVSLQPIQQLGWAQFYCKAMPLDPAQAPTTLLIHPDLSVPVMANGEVHLPIPPQPQPQTQARTPRWVICPSCFDKYETEKILYSDYEGAKPVAAQRTLMERLMGKPPKPPRDARGRVLPRKICPQCNKDLPLTAGSQESMIIGLVGAKFSGKSHYVASLIQRLSGQAGTDLHASILPVTRETPERYRTEFYEPLYKNYEELPFTVGTPPPLIYNLTFDGRLYGEQENRAVTLALYDTAGENFNDPDTVRRMVRYLSVASGVMFLVDPLQLDGVHEALEKRMDLPEREDPCEILKRVLHELQDSHVLAGGGRLPAPAAVVLTKADLLHDARLIEPNRLWCTDKRHVGRFDLQAHRDMSGMVGEYVQRWHPALYNLVSKRFAHQAFFAASSTGCASDRVKRYRFVSPRRVEDPVWWLLAELGVIPSR
jgi:hypothetical protein